MNRELPRDPGRPRRDGVVGMVVVASGAVAVMVLALVVIALLS